MKSPLKHLPLPLPLPLPFILLLFLYTTLFLPCLSTTPNPPAYLATWKGNFDTADSLRILINGQQVHDVLLHNASHVSFLVPNDIVTDPALLASSIIEIFRGAQKTTTIPLIVLKDALRKIEREYFDKLIMEKEIEQLQEGTHDGDDGHAEAQGTDSELAYDDTEYDDDTEDDDDEYYDDDDDDDEFEDDPAVEQPTEQNPSSTTEPTANPTASSATSSTQRTSEPDSTPSEPPMRNAPLSESKSDALLDSHPDAPSLSDVRLNERIASLESHFRSVKRHKPALLTELTTIATDDSAGSNNARAKVALASLLLSGRAGVDRDFPRAVSLLNDAASVGHPDANALLGFLHAAGLGVVKHVGAALLYWTLAAEGGSNFARMALAFRYFTGTDVEEDCERASEYYRLAADDVLRSFGKLGSSKSGGDINAPTPKSYPSGETKRLSEDVSKNVMSEKQEHVQYFRHTADRGDASAQVAMGNVYYHGAFDMPRDEQRARSLWQAAAAQGRADAHAHLGFLELRNGNNATAVKYLRTAAKNGDKFGLHGMGYALYHGIGVEKDYTEAFRHFKRAAEMDHAEAIYNVGIMYWRGIGVKKSVTEAYRKFQVAAQMRHVQSQYNVAMMLSSGAVSGGECSQIVGYLKAVAQTGTWQGVLSRAFRKYVAGDLADAAYGYLQAAHAGVEEAQFNAAFVFEKGLLTNRNGFRLMPTAESGHGRETVVEFALELYGMSASQSGHAESLVRLGDLAFEEEDYNRAAKAYEKAVKLRSAEAMFNLGWMHARGFGMDEDLFMAKRYFDQAREAHVDAIIPAVIAVFSLQYANVYKVLDKIMEGMKMVREVVEGEGSAVEGVVVVLLVLLLGIVVNTRQRRIVQADGEEQLQAGEVEAETEAEAEGEEGDVRIG